MKADNVKCNYPTRKPRPVGGELHFAYFWKPIVPLKTIVMSGRNIYHDESERQILTIDHGGVVK